MRTRYGALPRNAVYWFDNQGVPTTPPPEPCPKCPLVNWLIIVLIIIIAILLVFCFWRRR